ncbi:uncharacterized protein PAC_18071 [Phialocephala subalpina]|uniref:F-box domain-containing protein n=1 Tax=Phialocephala subalpina TaxID=576137 RepID=A0A1L7XT24_9HELO|nr:uncharacterized protein PAC_18071 [Phialocephala subalpina]
MEVSSTSTKSPPAMANEDKDSTAASGALTISDSAMDPQAAQGNGLPKDVMVYLIERLLAQYSMAASVSLGLTCRSFYHIFKSLRPEPVILYGRKTSFNSHEGLRPDDELQQREMAEMVSNVGNFMGPQYRLIWLKDWSSSFHTVFHFLKIEVYGRQRSMAESAFRRRRKDWSSLRYLPQSGKWFDVVYLLPSPFGKSDDDWYEEVARTVDNWDMKSLQEKAPYCMTRVWPKTYVYGRIQMDKVMAAWVDWTAMTDFELWTVCLSQVRRARIIMDKGNGPNSEKWTIYFG